MSNYVLSKETDFQLLKTKKPNYKFVKAPLYNITTSSIQTGPTTSTLLEFKLPTLIYNLYRSYIEYSVHLPGVGGKRNVTHEDVFDLGGTVSFGAAGGLDIVNLQWAQNYTKIRRKIDTPLDDMLTNDESSGLYPSNETIRDNIVPYLYDKYLSPTGDPYASVNNFLENKYAHIADAGQAKGVYRRYPLGAFTGTVFGVDRDFYGGNQEMYLRINAGTGDKIGYTTTGADVDVAAGASSIDNLTIKNVYLWLCVEENLDIVNEFHSLFNKGELEYNIPYTAAFKMPAPANGVVNHTIQLSQQYGRRLKRIMTTVWNNQERYHTAYDSNNWNGCKIKNYRTWMNNIPRQDRQISCLNPAGGVFNCEDWLENKKFVSKGSSILNRAHYAINWFHMDQFFEPHDRRSDIPEINVDEGLPMDQPHTFQFSAEINSDAPVVEEGIPYEVSNGANALFYIYAEFTRKIAITPEAVTFLPG